MFVYRLVAPAGTGFILLGALVMLGWVADIPLLKTLLPNAPAMKFFTALAILLGGVLLRSFYHLAMQETQEMSMTKVMASALFLFMIFFPLATAYFFDVDTGFETFGMADLFQRTNPVPNVGSIAAIAILFSLACSVSLGFSISKVSYWGGAALMGIGGLSLLGYALQEPSFYFLSGQGEGMSFHTAASFLLLGYFFVMLGIRPHLTGKFAPVKVTPHADAA